MKFSHTYLGWELTATDEGYTISNRSSDGTRRFYEVNSGQYGNPVIIAEPDLAFPAPGTLKNR